MNTLPSLHSFLQVVYPADMRREHFDGVDLRRMGDVAREHGTTRWKQAPAATGRNVDLVMLSLTSNHIALYSHDGNRADHGDGNLMTKAVLGQVHADDWVITLDLSCETARTIAQDSYGLTYVPVPDELLDAFRGDRIRAAVRHDVARIARQLLIPRLQPGFQR